MLFPCEITQLDIPDVGRNTILLFFSFQSVKSFHFKRFIQAACLITRIKIQAIAWQKDCFQLHAHCPPHRMKGGRPGTSSPNNKGKCSRFYAHCRRMKGGCSVSSIPNKRQMADHAGRRRSVVNQGTKLWRPPVEVTQFWRPRSGFGARFRFYKTNQK